MAVPQPSTSKPGKPAKADENEMARIRFILFFGIRTFQGGYGRFKHFFPAPSHVMLQTSRAPRSSLSPRGWPPARERSPGEPKPRISLVSDFRKKLFKKD
jgi:hypothetical protein